MKVMVVYQSPPDNETWRRLRQFVEKTRCQIEYLETYEDAYNEVLAELPDTLILMYSDNLEKIVATLLLGALSSSSVDMKLTTFLTPCSSEQSRLPIHRRPEEYWKTKN